MDKIAQIITPNLWFDSQAAEAAEFYTSVFKNSRINKVTRYPDAGQETTGQAAGTVMTVEFTVEGFEFVALNGGPLFSFNPSISFFVNCDNKEEVDALWAKLSAGGEALMPLDKYPFSERYGWIKDKYGVTWQLIYGNPEGDWRPKIIPSLLFVGNKAGQAEAAMNFYTTVFKNAKVSDNINHYPAGMEPDKEGTLMFGDFQLEGQWFAAMDSAHRHEFDFNEAISFIVNCRTQEEIDYYWEKLSAVPESEQCGWVKDKFGVSWQIVPTMLNELSDENPEANARLMKALLSMKKLNIAALQQAFDGE